MTEFKAGDLIGDYTIAGMCGSGSYGSVYRVFDRLGGEHALKILSAEKNSKREINALIQFRTCRHPNLLSILHIGRLPDGRFFYTMDLADSHNRPGEPYQPETLASKLEKSQRLAASDAERMIRELLAGLSELHQAHLLHRDIKPTNILFIHGHAVLADIGLVTCDSSASLIGTPDFMPAELLKSGRPMAASDDCYALGMVLYCMLTGTSPSEFPGTPHTLRSPEERRLLSVAERACTSPGFASTSEFLEFLNSSPPARHSRKHRFVYFGLGILILCAILFIVLWQEPSRPAAGSVTPNSTIPETTVASAPKNAQPVANPANKQISPLQPSAVAAPRKESLHPMLKALLEKYRLTEEEQRKLAEWQKKDKDLYSSIMPPHDATMVSPMPLPLFSEVAQRRQASSKALRQYEKARETALPSQARVAIFNEWFAQGKCRKIGDDSPSEGELMLIERALLDRNRAIRQKNP